MRRPITNTPEQLASLEGHQYLVLRPTGPVADDFATRQEQLLRGLPRSVTAPHTPHVTMRGFHEPDRVEDLMFAVRDWASSQHPIDVTAEAIDTFPAPWQIVLVRLARTATLVTAYSSLTQALDDTDFRRLGELDLADWIFHLSAVYAKALSSQAWAELEHTARCEYLDPVSETVAAAESVWYSEGLEHAEVIPLG